MKEGLTKATGVGRDFEEFEAFHRFQKGRETATSVIGDEKWLNNCDKNLSVTIQRVLQVAFQ